MNDTSAIAAGFHAALREKLAYAPPSAVEALDLPAAYAVQRAFNTLRTEPLAGYKSAANAETLRKLLQLSDPIVGALYATGARAPGSSIARGDYRNLLLETELGFRAARRIGSKVKSLAELRNATSVVVPMIELADPGFGRARMQGTDLIAANAASAGYIAGAARGAAEIDVNAVRVHFARGDEVLHEAEARDLMGDQWQALLWLVNTLLEVGYIVEPGQLLMTGSLGPAHPALPGDYRARFSDLGEIAFSIV